ncbi:MAG TPA: hypothetical protein VNN55_11465 [bacterium]|nr:hypothetical protein [bacterium]
MRRTLIIATLGAWMFAGGSAWGIDAKPKSETPAAKPAADTAGVRPAAPTRASRTLLEKLKEEVRESKKDEAVQYNNFIDANNDGVDDRVHEKAKVKPEESAPAEPAADGKKTLDEPRTKRTTSTPSKPENTSVKKKKPR